MRSTYVIGAANTALYVYTISIYPGMPDTVPLENKHGDCVGRDLSQSTEEKVEVAVPGQSLCTQAQAIVHQGVHHPENKCLK